VLTRDPASLKSLLDIAVDREASAAGTTAATMARAVRDKSKADWGLGVAAFPADGTMVPTAAAGPERREMTGSLHVALATAESVQVKAFPLASHPAITKTRSAKQALNMLRLALLNKRNAT
jgi:nicotinamide mononucleotide (NMN) deamidase PncC